MKKMIRLILSTLVFTATGAEAQERFDIGVRTVLSLSNGVPSNDIPGQGLFGHYNMSDRWSLGFGLDQAKFDFEDPAGLLGLAIDPGGEAVDPKVDALIVSTWLERRYPAASARGHWFLGSGLGVSSLDAPDVTGPLTTGGTFDITTDGGTEIIVMGLGGRRQRFGRRWAIEFAIKAEHHFADWKFQDRISGASGTIDDYFAYGGHLGVTFGF